MDEETIKNFDYIFPIPYLQSDSDNLKTWINSPVMQSKKVKEYMGSGDSRKLHSGNDIDNSSNNSFIHSLNYSLNDSLNNSKSNMNISNSINGSLNKSKHNSTSKSMNNMSNQSFNINNNNTNDRSNNGMNRNMNNDMNNIANNNKNSNSCKNKITDSNLSDNSMNEKIINCPPWLIKIRMYFNTESKNTTCYTKTNDYKNDLNSRIDGDNRKIKNKNKIIDNHDQGIGSRKSENSRKSDNSKRSDNKPDSFDNMSYNSSNLNLNYYKQKDRLFHTLIMNRIKHITTYFSTDFTTHCNTIISEYTTTIFDVFFNSFSESHNTVNTDPLGTKFNYIQTTMFGMSIFRHDVELTFYKWRLLNPTGYNAYQC